MKMKVLGLSLLVVSSAAISDSRSAEFLSDHFPIVAQFRTAADDD